MYWADGYRETWKGALKKEQNEILKNYSDKFFHKFISFAHVLLSWISFRMTE